MKSHLPLNNFVLIALTVVQFFALPSEGIEFSASSFVGISTSAVFPVPNATNAATELDSYFPPLSVVGNAGPTPTGDEAELLATATSVPKIYGAYPLQEPATADNKSSFDARYSWGPLSPMFSVDSFGLPKASMLIPEGCKLDQVHLVHRHGARYPSSGYDFADKLHNVTLDGSGFTAKGELSFLNTWTYKLGEELLTPFGRQQLFDLGVSFRINYGELLKDFTGLPVFRTTSEYRMVQSAENFAAGFFGIPDYQTNYRQLITIEDWYDSTLNNTLAPYCEMQNTIGYVGFDVGDKWAEVYLKDALSRISSQIEGLNLTITDVFEMQELCAFETVALGASAFCNLFTEEEWKGYEYYQDLVFWYTYGPGNPTTAAIGIGYVHELVSRLTQTPITIHNSTTNATLDNDNITFPLNQPIYVDATHDTIITSILVAMNFTSMAAGGPLPRDYRPENQTYYANQLAPFAAQLIGQVMSCPSDSSEASSDTQQFIRWLLNDAVIPLTGINGCPQDENGLCSLPVFIESMQSRITEVDYAQDCNGNYTFDVWTDSIVDGRPNRSMFP